MIPDKQQKADSNQSDLSAKGVVAWAYHPQFGWSFVRLPSSLTVKAVRAETRLLALADFHGMTQEVAEGYWIWLASRAPLGLDNEDEEGRCSTEAAAKHALLGAMTRLGIIERPKLDFPVIRKLDVAAIQAARRLLDVKPQGIA